jgi:hypothetical protein
VQIVQSSMNTLLNSIILQQDETDRRHKEKLEAIQEKAFRMTILRHSTEDHNDAPKLVPYETKKICIICNVMVSLCHIITRIMLENFMSYVSAVDDHVNFCVLS